MRFSLRKASPAVLLFSVAVALSQTAAAYDANGSFSRTLTVSGTPDVEITTGSGNITVHSGNATSVIVQAKIHASDSWFGGGSSAAEKVKRIESNPPISQSGSVIKIGRIEDRDLRNNVSISYDVTMPNTSRLR